MFGTFKMFESFNNFKVVIPFHRLIILRASNVLKGLKLLSCVIVVIIVIVI